MSKPLVVTWRLLSSVPADSGLMMYSFRSTLSDVSIPAVHVSSVRSHSPEALGVKARPMLYSAVRTVCRSNK